MHGWRVRGPNEEDSVKTVARALRKRRSDRCHGSLQCWGKQGQGTGQGTDGRGVERETGDGGSVMLHTEMFGYADPRRGRPLARCGQCELTWCVALRERRGASASGVDLVQLERAMDGWDVGREYTATEKRSGVERESLLATYFVTHHDELGHACRRATFTERVPCDVV